MLQESAVVLRKGEGNGDNMLVRFRLPSGLEIAGLPTENSYGGEWDLGPTWNYLVYADRPFLVDVGNVGKGEKLLEMMATLGFSPADLKSVILTHGHEDHDGGLFEVTRATGAKPRAHWIYDRLNHLYPDQAPSEDKKAFPASCWRCFFPTTFTSRHCSAYHQHRCRIGVETIGNDHFQIDDITHTYHLPGHCPDALAIFLGEEAVFVGDTLLSGITPMPSQEQFYHAVEPLLSPECMDATSVYGLRTYIRSLKRLLSIADQMSDLLVLPGHRLFYGNTWNDILIRDRIEETIEHHVQRCSDIVGIVRYEPKTVREIASLLFSPKQLKGVGMVMAENEILSHCEILTASGDVNCVEGSCYKATGTSKFESDIRSWEPF